MSRKVYNKLVRDKVPQIIKAAGHKTKTSSLNNKQFKTALEKKLVEETQELIGSKYADDVLREISDVLEVLESIAKLNKIPQSKIEKIKFERRKERGGFSKKLFLKYVDD